jgi:hypothetical protein
VTAKVFSLEAFRKKREANRGVKFDHERGLMFVDGELVGVVTELDSWTGDDGERHGSYRIEKLY